MAGIASNEHGVVASENITDFEEMAKVTDDLEAERRAEDEEFYRSIRLLKKKVGYISKKVGFRKEPPTEKFKRIEAKKRKRCLQRKRHLFKVFNPPDVLKVKELKEVDDTMMSFQRCSLNGLVDNITSSPRKPNTPQPTDLEMF